MDVGQILSTEGNYCLDPLLQLCLDHTNQPIIHPHYAHKRKSLSRGKDSIYHTLGHIMSWLVWAHQDRLVLASQPIRALCCKKIGHEVSTCLRLRMQVCVLPVALLRDAFIHRPISWSILCGMVLHAKSRKSRCVWSTNGLVLQELGSQNEKAPK